MISQPLDEEAVFHVACGISSAELRREYLSQVCGENAPLLDRVSTLLRAREQDPSFLESPASEAAPTLTVPGAEAEKPGMMVGRYKLLEEIGEGGMGLVYMAEQREPVRRKVALKIIKPGMDTRQVIARFEAERQALAMMEHPNIAHVFDGGATDSGRPYFVMELVRGMPITQYCDEARRTTDERLQLFILVCDAVQHAHQKGIIHRDLKPRNVLVTLHGETPVPKIIDFGVAKATHGQLTDKTVFTGFGQMIGTPLYMSPEQLALSGLDVDTRSDIYSLGVLLYELLTGVPPFDRDRFRELSLDEIRCTIREEEPPRPSSRISTLAAEATSTISANRKTDSATLRHSLRRELDWIVMKALEKDRTRRYQSANDLGKDVQRYLDGEAVEACPPSTWYRLRKYARRRKALLTTSAVLAAMMLVATAVSVSFSIQANAEKDKALAAQELADKRLAQSRLDFERALKALDTVVEQLSSPEFAQIPGAEKTRSDVLARMLELYESLAEEHDDPHARQQQAQAYKRIANIHQISWQHAEALAAINQGIAIIEELLEANPDDKGYKLALSELLYDRLHMKATRSREERLEDAQRALALRKELIEHGSNEHIYAVGLLHLKVADLLPEDSPLIDQYLRDSIRIPEQHGTAPNADSYVHLAARLEKKGETAEAEKNYRRALEREKQSAGNWHPTGRRLYCDTCIKFAEFLNGQGRFEEAKVFYLESIEIARQLYVEYGKTPWYGSGLGKTVRSYMEAARTEQHREEVGKLTDQLLAEFPEAENLHQVHAELLSKLEDAEARLSAAIEEYPRRVEYYQQRAKVFESHGDSEKTLADLSEAIRLAPNVALHLEARADAFCRLGRFDEALVDLNKIVEFKPSDAGAYFSRGSFYLEHIENYEKALADLDKSLQLDPNAAYRYKRRAVAHFHLGNYNKALADIAKAVELKPDDLSALRWIGLNDVAQCPDEQFRAGLLKLADKAIELTHQSARAYAVRGRLLAAFGRQEEAFENLERAFERLSETGSPSIPGELTLEKSCNDLSVLCAQLAHRDETMP